MPPVARGPPGEVPDLWGDQAGVGAVGRHQPQGSPSHHLSTNPFLETRALTKLKMSKKLYKHFEKKPTSYEEEIIQYTIGS